MSNDGPGDLSILQLGNRDLTSESTIGLVEDVLGGNGNLLRVGDLLGEGQVESRRRDDDLGGLVELGLIEVLDDGGNAFRSTVPVLQERQRVSVSFLVGCWCGIRSEGVLRGSSGGGSKGDVVHLEVTTDEELARHFECVFM